MEETEQEKKSLKGGIKILSEFSSRTTLFTSMMVNYTRSNQTIAFLLRFLEFAQILHFSISPHISRMWTSTYFGYLQSALKFLNYQSARGGDNIETETPALITVLCINLIVASVTVFLLGFSLSTSKNPSGLAVTLTKLLAFYTLVFKSLLVVPFAQISYMTIFCRPVNEEIAGTEE